MRRWPLKPKQMPDRTDVVELGRRHHTIITWERDHVRASVVAMGHGTAELIGLGAAPVHGLGPTTHPDVDRWAAGCDRAITQAEDMTVTTSGFKRVPDLLSMSVPAEVARRIPITVRYDRRQPSRPVATEEMNTVLERGYRKAQDVVGARGRGAEAEIVHGTVAEILLDNQSVLDPVGLHGAELSVQMSFGVIPVEWVRTLEAVAGRLELRLVGIVPHDVVYAAPIADSAALLIVLDEHHTTVDLVHHGRLAWSVSTAHGEREVLVSVARTLGLAGHQADGLMHLYRTQQLPPEGEALVAQAFWAELRAWMDAMAERVNSMLHEGVVPHHIYFLDATRHIPEAQPCLDTPYWEAKLPFDRCPETIPLDVSMVRGVLDYTTQATGQSYLLLRGMAHYVASLYSAGTNLERALANIIARRRSGI